MNRQIPRQIRGARPGRIALILALALWAGSLAAQTQDASTAPAAAPAPRSAYSVYGKMKANLATRGSFSFHMRARPFDALTQQPMMTMEADVLRSGVMFSVITQITDAPANTYPDRTIAVFDGRYLVSHVQGLHTANRLDIERVAAEQRASFLAAQTPPVLPDLPPGAGTLREETVDRKLFHVISAENLENECHGISRFTLWIEADTGLPARLEADFRTDRFLKMETASGAQALNRPMYMILEYSDWRYETPAPAARFGFVAPEGVRILESDPPAAEVATDSECPNCPQSDLKKLQQTILNSVRAKLASENAPVTGP